MPASGFTANGFRTNGHATVLKVKDAATRDVRMSNGAVSGADRVLDMVDNRGQLNGFSFQKVVATGLDRGFFRVRNASNGLVQDVVAVGGKTTDYYPTGFATSDLATRNLTFERVIARGFHGKPGKSYTNGDGWAQEELSANTVLRDCLAIDNADGGYDMKGQLTATRIAAANNYRNLRLWGSFNVTDFTSINPRNAGIWFGGGDRFKGGTITRPTFIGNGSAPDIKIDSNTPAVTVTIIDPVTPGNRPLKIDKEGGSKVTLVIKYTGSKQGVVAQLPALPQVAGASQYGLGG